MFFFKINTYTYDNANMFSIQIVLIEMVYAKVHMVRNCFDH